MCKKHAGNVFSVCLGHKHSLRVSNEGIGLDEDVSTDQQKPYQFDFFRPFYPPFCTHTYTITIDF